MGAFFSHKIDAVQRLLLSNSISDWLIAGIVAVAVWSGLWILRQLIASRYKKYSVAQHRLPLRLIAYLAGNTRQFLFFAIALYAAQDSLNLPDRIQYIVSRFVLILILLQAGLWAGRSVRFYLESKQLERGADQVFAGSLDIINFVARLVIWSLLVLVALDNVGVNITALLAGLGVGGVAVALALQNVLGDLFASLSIALDKPFVVGDSLSLDTFIGKVEHIGIKTTRLRSETRRANHSLERRYPEEPRAQFRPRPGTARAGDHSRGLRDAHREAAQSIPRLLEGIVREQANARFERCHLKTLGDSALHFELSYFVQQPNLNPLLDLQQAVNFRIIDEFRRLGVEFDYPTQRVILARPPPP